MSKLSELSNKISDLKSRYKTGGINDCVVELEKKLKEVCDFAGVDFDKESKEKNKIIEAAPIGSFAYTQEKINRAINAMPVFDPDGDGDNDKYNCYVYYTFPDRVILTCDDCYYEMNYTIDADGNVTFGDPVEVEQYFTATESAAFKVKGTRPNPKAKELKESGIEIIREAVDMDFDSGFLSAHIQEGSYDANTGEVDVVIIEAGTNPLKKRHYPVSTIQEAAPVFKGMKMYINHQTDKEEKERPERDLRDWVSTIQESHFDNGKAVGRVYIHDSWLRERMGDPVFAKNVGLSINTGGKISYGKINGEEMQIVEKINPTRSNGSGSVDWVTEAGARGRVIRPIKESASTDIELEENMKLNEVTLDQLQKENPDLVKKIQESAKPADDKMADVLKENAELKKKDRLRDQKEKVSALLKESKLPEAAQERIIEDVKETLFESDDKLKEAIGERVKKELEYINKFSTKGRVILPAGNGGRKIDAKEENNALTEAQSTLEKRFGIKNKKKDEDEEEDEE